MLAEGHGLVLPRQVMRVQGVAHETALAIVVARAAGAPTTAPGTSVDGAHLGRGVKPTLTAVAFIADPLGFGYVDVAVDGDAVVLVVSCRVFSVHVVPGIGSHHVARLTARQTAKTPDSFHHTVEPLLQAVLGWIWAGN